MSLKYHQKPLYFCKIFVFIQLDFYFSKDATGKINLIKA